MHAREQGSFFGGFGKGEYGTIRGMKKRSSSRSAAPVEQEKPAERSEQPPAPAAPGERKSETTSEPTAEQKFLPKAATKAQLPSGQKPEARKDTANQKASGEGKVMPGTTLMKQPTNPAEFAKMVAFEVVRSLSTIGKLRPFSRDLDLEDFKELPAPDGDNLILIDTSILVDGRILPIVNSGFLAGTLLVPEFVLGELQHIADSSDSLRRAKGRRGLEVVTKLKSQKVNDQVKTNTIRDDVADVKEVDHKLLGLAKFWKAKLMTVDFNLAQLARAHGVKVLNVNDLTQALKLSVIPGEELVIKITHEGKEREQGVGYLPDGTMVVVDNAKDKVGIDVSVVVSKVHQTAAGQLFFARLK